MYLTYLSYSSIFRRGYLAFSGQENPETQDSSCSADWERGCTFRDFHQMLYLKTDQVRASNDNGSGWLGESHVMSDTAPVYCHLLSWRW